MTVAVDMRPATRHEVLEIARSLRDRDAREITALGKGVQKELVRCWRRAYWSRAAFVAGEACALWGVNGDLISGRGRPWLLTTPCIARLTPLQFARLYRAEVTQMLETFPRLENYADATYAAALRLLQLMGFTVDDPIPFGPQRVPFCRFWKDA